MHISVSHCGVGPKLASRNAWNGKGAPMVAVDGPSQLGLCRSGQPVQRDDEEFF